VSEVIVPLEHGVECSDDAEDLGWQERALCAQTDPEAFFPEKAARPGGEKVCRGCEVRPSAWSSRWRTTNGLVSGAACRSGASAAEAGSGVVPPRRCRAGGRGPRRRDGGANRWSQSPSYSPVDAVRVEPQQLGEFLHHHVEDQLAQLILVVGPREQRPAVQHDPGRARTGHVARTHLPGVDPGQRDRDDLLAGDLLVRYFCTANSIPASSASQRGSSRATASRTRSSNCCARLRYSGTSVGPAGPEGRDRAGPPPDAPAAGRNWSGRPAQLPSVSPAAARR